MPSGSVLQGRYLDALRKRQTDLTALSTQGEAAQRAANEADAAAFKDCLEAPALWEALPASAL